jgi:hypothetical protein
VNGGDDVCGLLDSHIRDLDSQLFGDPPDRFVSQPVESDDRQFEMLMPALSSRGSGELRGVNGGSVICEWWR